MKLRNKIGGGVAEVLSLADDPDNGTIELIFCMSKDGHELRKEYHSLAELIAEWEDYVPKEPIEDDKMRQCVKLWTEINGFKDKLMYAEGDGWCSFYEEDEDEELLFRNRKCPNLDNRASYPIAELCGDDKE